MSGDDDDEYDDDGTHARRGDPWTSHAAAASVKMSKQRHQVLRAYYLHRREMIDHDAYRLSGLTVAINGARPRCSDLRRAGWIEWTGNIGTTPSGKAAKHSAITAEGITAYEMWELFRR